MKNRIILSLLLPALALSACRKDPAVSGGASDGNEYTYITVPYMRKTNGAYTTGWDSTLSTQTLLVANMNRMVKKEQYELDKWGGNPDLKVSTVVSTNSAGFWRTGKVGNRWYFIDPDGNAAVLHGLNGVTPDPLRDGTTAETQNYYNMAFGGNVQRWAEYAGEVLSDYAFNFFSVSPRRAAYYWEYNGQPVMDDNSTRMLRSPKDGIENGQVETLYLLRGFSWDYYSKYKVSFSTSEHNIFVLLFDPLFLSYIDALAQEATAPFRESKNIIGYYIDNELPFNSYKDQYPLRGIELEHFLLLQDKFDGQFAAARKFAADFMTENYKVEAKAENITVPMRDAFRSEIARYYYKVTTEAIRRHDPNHLILGSRLFDQSMYNANTVKACAEYCDVVSVNYYNYWQPQPLYCNGQLKVWVGDAKPFMVTEFYTKDSGASFGTTAYQNLEGAGWIVKDQKARGAYYQNFCIRLLEMGNCVGWQWFEFMDNYGTGASTVWTGANKGVVSARFEPYYDCLDMMRELHLNIYQITDYIDNKNK